MEYFEEKISDVKAHLQNRRILREVMKVKLGERKGNEEDLD